MPGGVLGTKQNIVTFMPCCWRFLYQYIDSRTIVIKTGILIKFCSIKKFNTALSCETRKLNEIDEKRGHQMDE